MWGGKFDFNLNFDGHAKVTLREKHVKMTQFHVFIRERYRREGAGDYSRQKAVEREQIALGVLLCFVVFGRQTANTIHDVRATLIISFSQNTGVSLAFTLHIIIVIQCITKQRVIKRQHFRYQNASVDNDFLFINMALSIPIFIA